MAPDAHHDAQELRDLAEHVAALEADLRRLDRLIAATQARRDGLRRAVERARAGEGASGVHAAVVEAGRLDLGHVRELEEALDARHAGLRRREQELERLLAQVREAEAEADGIGRRVRAAAAMAEPDSAPGGGPQVSRRRR